MIIFTAMTTKTRSAPIRNVARVNFDRALGGATGMAAVVGRVAGDDFAAGCGGSSSSGSGASAACGFAEVGSAFGCAVCDWLDPCGSGCVCGAATGSAVTTASHHGHGASLPSAVSGTWNGLPQLVQVTGTNMTALGSRGRSARSVIVGLPERK